MKHLNRSMIIISLSIIVLLSVFVIKLYTSREKNAYVELNTLYDGFLLKNELQLKLDQVKTSRKQVIDSIKLELETMASEIKNSTKENLELKERYKIVYDEYYRKSDFFEQSNNELAKQYTEQIWNQINQYVDDYASKNDYTYLFGANNSGTIMYAEKTKNCTNEVLEYINNKYEGKITDNE